MMTPMDFEQALDRWGSELDAWPDGAGDEARALLAADPEAARQLSAARRVDGFLLELRRHHPTAGLPARVTKRVAEAAADPADRLLGWLGARLWRPALIALVVTTAGFLAGAMVGSPAVDPQLAEAVTTLAFNDIYAEVENAQP